VVACGLSAPEPQNYTGAGSTIDTTDRAASATSRRRSVTVADTGRFRACRVNPKLKVLKWRPAPPKPPPRPPGFFVFFLGPPGKAPPFPGGEKALDCYIRLRTRDVHRRPANIARKFSGRSARSAFFVSRELAGRFLHWTKTKSLDPILFTDQRHGAHRLFSQLDSIVPPASPVLIGLKQLPAFSDDDGANLDSRHSSIADASYDHQTVGAGPYPASCH